MSREHHFSTRVRWTGAQEPDPRDPLVPEPGAGGVSRYTRDMLVEAPGKPQILGSSSRAFKGDDGRYNPEDLMLASLGECHVLTYLALAGKEKIRLRSLEVEVTGVLGLVDGKMRFREATIVARTRVALAEDIERATALHDGAHADCFMSNSVNFPIAIRPTVSAGD
jgi:organic hydroperoxide reductase OsmC/OhrA